jgi:hypothetical protein
MNEINQNSINKPDAPITRFFILPVKPYVAKFLFFEPKNIFKILSPKEKEATLKQIKNINENQKHLKGKFWYYFDWNILFKEKIQMTFKFYQWFFIENDYLKKRNDSLQFEYFNNNELLSHYHLQYVEKGYKLIKINAIVSKKLIKHKPDINLFPTIEWKIDYFNDALKNAIFGQLALFIHNRGNNTIKNVINDIFTIYDITSDDLNKSTVEKYYQRNKDELKRLYDSYFPEDIHGKIDNRTIIHYYKLFLENKLSLNQISERLNISESTIKRIFSNPEIQKSIKK